MRRSAAIVSSFAILLAAAGVAHAQLDTLTVIVDGATATGGSSLGAFGYDRNNNAIYTVSFGSSASLRRITGIGGTPVGTEVLSIAQIQMFLRDGDPTRSVNSPIQSGFIFNPASTPGGNPPFNSAWISDIATTNQPGGSTTSDPAATKRLYRYNLGNPPVNGDGRDVLTPLVSLADKQTASGVSTGNDNFGRQPAFSPDGKWIYATDTSSALGGVYRIQPDTGAVTRILVGPTSGTTLITEPAVLKEGVADRIFFRGNSAGGNVGGINYVDHDPTTGPAGTTSAQQVLLTKAELLAFLEKPDLPASAPDIHSISADAGGNLFFWDNTNKVLVRRDTAGRLSKVTTRTERDAALTPDGIGGTTPNANLLRQQPRTIDHPGAGQVTQVLYAEQSSLNLVAGATVFLPGDFNRDGDADVNDLAMFAPKLTLRGVASPIEDARYDFNGNLTIDYKDVKLAQTFFGFADGDANLDLSVNFSDLLALARNYGQPERKWTHGDFNGDETVNFPDLLVLAKNYNSGPTASLEGDWALAQSMVPEPGISGLLAAGSVLSLSQRRRQKR